jgi:hypothetical protein
MRIKNRSLIMKAYNQVRSQTLRTSGIFDRERLNKGLGLLMSNAQKRYAETYYDCTCRDHEIRGEICKHMLRCLIESWVFFYAKDTGEDPYASHKKGKPKNDPSE